MPGGDRTGPWARGPRTGRAMGFCAGYPSPGYIASGGRGGRCFLRRGYGRGMGRGYGRGFGRGSRAEYGPWMDDDPAVAAEPRVWSAPSRNEEKAYLEEVRESLEREMDAIKKRLQELSEAVEE